MRSKGLVYRVRRSFWFYRGYRRAKKGQNPSDHQLCFADQSMIPFYLAGHRKGTRGSAA